MMIPLGVEVKDTITGFRGTVIARTVWLHGCIRITVQPKAKDDGTQPDGVCIDEPQLELVKAARAQAKGKGAHGPRPAATQHKSPSR